MAKEFSVTEAQRNDILRHLPVINKIRDEVLREDVIRVWERFRRDSPYASIGDAPGLRTELAGNETLVRHTLAATRMAVAAARQFQQVYHKRLNFDVLLAGGVLHDVDKIVLYGKHGDEVGWSELGKKEKHGEYGARIARDFGIPKEVLNIMESHSPKRTIMPEPIEAAILIFSDLGCLQAFRMMSGLKFEP